MLLWSFSFICLIQGLRFLFEDAGISARILNQRRENLALQQVVFLLHELQETLEAGLVPRADRWDAIRSLRAPWGSLTYGSLQQLRSQGGSLLPTIRRLRDLAEQHQGALKDARSKSAQALAQALVCALMVPLFGTLLYWLLPGVGERSGAWIMACVSAMAISGLGALWLLSMAESARWGGLETGEQNWVLSAQCAGERFLAMVRSGNPPDLAWGDACEFLSQESPELAARWGHSVWVEKEGDSKREGKAEASGSRNVLLGVGGAIRKAIHISLMEGRPCSERVEGVLMGLRRDLRSEVDRELSLLATRALKPLFLCVAPSMLGLLFYGLFLGWDQYAGGVGWSG